MRKNKFFLLVVLVVSIALLPGVSDVWAQTKVIAHRGYWDCEGSAQNSIASLNKAHELGVYGSEFDVALTADGVLVVNHDNAYQGHVIQTSTYNELKNLKLANGETFPTLEQYLVQGKKNKGTQLILEIKPHKRVVDEDKAVKEILKLVKKYKLEKQVEYISFSMNICKEIIRQSPKSQIAYLKGDVSPKDLKTLGFTGLDYNYKVYQQNPIWIKEAKELGLSVNVWTIDDPTLMRAFISQQVDYITTDKPVELKKILNE